MKWQKGQSGNPKGRVKGKRALSEELRRLVDARWQPRGPTNRELLAQVLLRLALCGDIKALSYIYDRLEGRPAQALELSGDDRKPLRIEYVVAGGKEAGEGSHQP